MSCHKFLKLCTSELVGKMFKGDFTDMCASIFQKWHLVEEIVFLNVCVPYEHAHCLITNSKV